MTEKLDREELQTVSDKIHKALESGDSVLVHCAQGKSRSTTVLTAFLQTQLGTSIDDTLAFIKSKRNMAEPNENFIQQLKNMEKENQLPRLINVNNSLVFLRITYTN